MKLQLSLLAVLALAAATVQASQVGVFDPSQLARINNALEPIRAKTFQYDPQTGQATVMGSQVTQAEYQQIANQIQGLQAPLRNAKAAGNVQQALQLVDQIKTLKAQIGY